MPAGQGEAEPKGYAMSSITAVNLHIPRIGQMQPPHATRSRFGGLASTLLRTPDCFRPVRFVYRADRHRSRCASCLHLHRGVVIRVTLGTMSQGENRRIGLAS